MILPWWSKYVGYALVVLLACFYTGVKVANHYEDRLAKIEVIGVVQKERVKIIEGKQKEVVKYVNRQVSRDIALSDDYYRLRYAGSREVSNFAGTASRVDETTKADTFDPACTPADGSADALTIIAWQTFYRQLREAQR